MVGGDAQLHMMMVIDFQQYGTCEDEHDAEDKDEDGDEDKLGTEEKVPQRNCVTKILPNIQVNFLVRFASKPLLYWVMTR